MKSSSKNGQYWWRPSDTKLARGNTYGQAPGRIVDWELLWVRVGQGLRRIWVALSYKASQRGFVLPDVNFPIRKYWFRLALVGVVVFILAQKEMQFSVRMLDRQPEGLQAQLSQESVADQMNFAQAISWANPRSVDVANELDPVDVDRFILRFERVARTEQEKFGIPASVKMAMGILASRAGTDEATIVEHNYFGPVMEQSTFGNAWENWRAHSLLIQRHYPELAQYVNQPEQWLSSLQERGYSRDRDYVDQVLTIVDRYGLNRLDQEI